MSGRKPQGLSGDNRGLAISLLGFFAMIVIAALLYIMFEPAASELMDMSLNQASDQDVKDAIKLRQEIALGGIMFFALFLSGLKLIASAVRESGGVR